MAFKMIYFIGLVLLANSIFCFSNRSPKRGPSPCNWPYVSRCLINFKPTFGFKLYFPVIPVSFKKNDDNLQMGPSLFSFPEKMKNEHSDSGKDEKQDSFLHVSAGEQSRDISDDKIDQVTTTIPNGNNIILNDFNVFNTQISTNSDIDIEYTTNYGNDNTITTTEEEDVTTEGIFNRLSDIPPAVLATFLG
ncbi:uncharacterized protein LOC126768307 [Nymphalis io]|uniref:uncharacterized protein LOC126768307 n=1 Tax=Inachis io TaxID=171585 RepID=UPI002168192C|nr:uncharacterized protein LOC126768307 [Nymphalis io]